MSSSHEPVEDDDFEEEEAAMLDPDEAAEEIAEDADAAMDSGDEGDEEMMQEEIQLQNDSVAYFDLHKDSIFTIAQHPLHYNIVATGGSEGEDAGGIGYIFDSTPPQRPVLPASYQSAPGEPTDRNSLDALFKLEGHTDSINALVFTLPKGEVLVSGGLDGKLRAYCSKSEQARSWQFLAEVHEVEEINWLSACPHPSHANTIALGANDGSVWIYTIDTTKEDPFQLVVAKFLHKGPCTAGAWTPDGKMLATVSEDGSLYVLDPFDEAQVLGVGEGQAVISLTAKDQRFAVEGGLYSVAVSPTGAFLVVGGAGGVIKVIGLPRLTVDKNTPSKAKGGKKVPAASAIGQAGQILADLQAQSDGIETLAFAPPPLTLLAAGSVDGSIALYDSAYRFAVRRHIKEAHEDFSVVKVEFTSVSSSSTKTGNASTSGAGISEGWILTSCGMDGVIRQWDARGGTAMANSGFLREWRGHRGEGEGGGVLGFVQGGGRIVTAGDDGVALVFDTESA